MQSFHRAFLFLLSPRWRLVTEIETCCRSLPECVCRAAARLAPRWVLGGSRAWSQSNEAGGEGRAHVCEVGPRLRTSAEGRLGQEGRGAVHTQQENAFMAARPRERQVQEACAAEMRVIRGPDGPQDCCRSAHQLWLVCAISVKELGDWLHNLWLRSSCLQELMHSSLEALLFWRKIVCTGFPSTVGEGETAGVLTESPSGSVRGVSQGLRRQWHTSVIQFEAGVASYLSWTSEQ